MSAFIMGCSNAPEKPNWADDLDHIELNGDMWTRTKNHTSIQPRFSPDGNLLAVGGRSRDDELAEYCEAIVLWDVKTAERLKILKLSDESSDYITSIAFSQDGSSISAITRMRQITTWSVESGAVLSSDNYYSKDKQLEENTPGFSVFHGFGEIPQMAVRGDGEIVAVGFSVGRRSKEIGEHRNNSFLWQPGTSATNLSVSNFGLSQNGETLVTFTGSDIEVWETAPARRVKKLKIQDSSYLSPIALSKDGTALALKVEDGFQIWDLLTEEKTCDINEDGRGSSIKSMALSKKGRLLAIGVTQRYSTGGGDFLTLPIPKQMIMGKIKLLDTRSREATELTPYPENAIQDPSVIFSNTYRNTYPRPIIPEVHSLEFSPDGNVLVSTHEKGKVILWWIPAVFDN